MEVVKALKNTDPDTASKFLQSDLYIKTRLRYVENIKTKYFQSNPETRCGPSWRNPGPF